MVKKEGHRKVVSVAEGLEGNECSGLQNIATFLLEDQSKIMKIKVSKSDIASPFKSTVNSKWFSFSEFQFPHLEKKVDSTPQSLRIK